MENGKGCLCWKVSMSCPGWALLHPGEGLILGKNGILPPQGQDRCPNSTAGLSCVFCLFSPRKGGDSTEMLLRNGAASESRANSRELRFCHACHRITALFVIKSHQSGTFCGAVAFAGCSEAAECHRQYFPCAENLPKSRGL